MSIFLSAVTSVFGNLGTALRVLLLPLAVLVTVNLWSLDPGFEGGVLPEIVAGLVDMTFAVLVAVGWHRFVLLRETPGELMPRWNSSAMWAYFLTWFALGLVILLAVLAVVFALYMILTSVFLRQDPVASGLLESIAYGVVMGSGSRPLELLVFALVVWAFLYPFFRLGLCLPARAAYEKGVKLRRSWDLTRPMRGGIAMASLIAALCVSVLLYGPMIIDLSAPIGDEPSYILASVLTDVGYGLNVLFGAAIFNEIFRRAMPTGEAPCKEN